MSATRTWEAEVARKLGIGGVIDFSVTRLGQTLHVPCSRGPDGHGHLVDVKIRPNLDPNGTCKQMIGAGWIVGRRRLICPDCLKKPKKTDQLPVPRDSMAKARSVITPEQRREWGRKGAFKKHANRLAREGKIPAAPTPTLRRDDPKMAQEPAPPSASDKARAAKRETMDLLTLSFKLAADGKTGQYETGYTDARIAKETGLAESNVAKMREEFFAPLGEPDELVAIRADLAQARLDLAATRTAGEQEIARIERKLASLRTKMGWPVA